MEKEAELERLLEVRRLHITRLRLLENVSNEDLWLEWRKIQEIAARVPKRVSRHLPLELQLSANAVAFEALPIAISSYSDELVMRIKCFSIGDGIAVYRTFVSR